MKIQKIYI